MDKNGERLDHTLKSKKLFFNYFKNLLSFAMNWWKKTSPDCLLPGTKLSSIARRKKEKEQEV
jgi:hypothetical protein